MGLYKIGICSKLGTLLDSNISSLNRAKSSIINLNDKLVDKLANIQWSADNDVNNAISSINNNYSEMIPESDETDEIIDMINECNFLSETIYQSPIALVKNLSDPIKQKAVDFMSNICDNLPEFDGVKMYNEIVSKIKTQGFKELIDGTSKIITCINTLCDQNIQEKINIFQSILTECKMDSEGNLSISNILSDVGISDQSKIDNFTNLILETNNVFDNIDSNLSSVVDSFKSNLQF